MLAEDPNLSPAGLRPGFLHLLAEGFTQGFGVGHLTQLQSLRRRRNCSSHRRVGVNLDWRRLRRLQHLAGRLHRHCRYPPLLIICFPVNASRRRQFGSAQAILQLSFGRFSPLSYTPSPYHFVGNAFKERWLTNTLALSRHSFVATKIPRSHHSHSQSWFLFRKTSPFQQLRG